MNFDELSEYAYNQKEIPKISNLPTKYAYLQLSDLYYRYKLGDFSKEESIALKVKIKKEYESNIDEYKRYLEIYKYYNDNRIKNGLLLAELEKSNDKNKIIEVLLRIVSNCHRDNTIFDRNIQKIDKENTI